MLGRQSGCNLLLGLGNGGPTGKGTEGRSFACFRPTAGLVHPETLAGFSFSNVMQITEKGQMNSKAESHPKRAGMLVRRTDGKFTMVLYVQCFF